MTSAGVDSSNEESVKILSIYSIVPDTSVFCLLLGTASTALPFLIFCKADLVSSTRYPYYFLLQVSWVVPPNAFPIVPKLNLVQRKLDSLSWSPQSLQGWTRPTSFKWASTKWDSTVCNLKSCWEALDTSYLQQLPERMWWICEKGKREGSHPLNFTLYPVPGTRTFFRTYSIGVPCELSR